MRFITYSVASLLIVVGLSLLSRAQDESAEQDKKPQSVVTGSGELVRPKVILQDYESRHTSTEGIDILVRETVRSLHGTDEKVRHGLYQRYENGTLRSEGFYYMGLQHGYSRVWYDNGQLRSEASAVEGAVHGVYRGWRRDGSLLFESPYVAGSKHGVAREWRHVALTSDDKPWKTTSWVYDRRSGPYTENHANDILAVQGHHEDNERYGQWTFWHINGQKESEGAYHRDQKCGKWSYWDDTGKLLRTIDYGEPRKE